MTKVVGQRCDTCGYLRFPERLICPECRSQPSTAVPIERARIESLTRAGVGELSMASLALDHGDILIGRLYGEAEVGDIVEISPYPGVAGTAHVPDRPEGRPEGSTHPMRTLTPREQTVPRLVQRQADLLGEKPLVVFDSETWTYRDLRDRAARAGGALAGRGLGTEDTIAVLCGNRPEFLDLAFGSGWIGAAIVPVNTAARGLGLRHVFADSGARMVFVEGALTAALTAEALPPNVERIVLLDDVADEERRRLRSLAHLETYQRYGDAVEPTDVGPHNMAAVIYTSGTTGMPKGVVCPHAQLFWFGVEVGELLELTPEDVLLTTLPLFHINALTAIFQTMLAGATIVVKERFSASRYWHEVQEHGVTCGFLLGAMIAILYARDRSEYLPGHRLSRVLAPSTPPSLAHRFIDEFGVGIVDSYASTETNAIFGSRSGDYRAGYMGRLSPGYEARVVDENGLDVPDGVAGELLCRPHHPFAFSRGYLNNPSATTEAFADLWFHTGDRVVRDPGGWYRFVDRMKDTIRRRGENIASLEVESAILAHPAVRSVAVYAVPSEFAEDEVMVSLTLRDGATLAPSDLTSWLDGRIPYFAVPRYVAVLDDLPVTESGKVSKVRLRERGVTSDTWDRGEVRR